MLHGNAERIYRVSSVKFNAHGAWLGCIVDSRFSTSVVVNADQVASVLLESEVKLDNEGRFRRAD